MSSRVIGADAKAALGFQLHVTDVFLEELAKVSDDNIGLIKQLVSVLTAALPVPCTDTEKETLKTSTESKVSAAKAKATEFKEEKEKMIEEFVQIVIEANKQIEEANNQLVANGAPTIPAVTPIFEVTEEPEEPETPDQPGGTCRDAWGLKTCKTFAYG